MRTSTISGRIPREASATHRRVDLARVILLGAVLIAGSVMNVTAYESVEPLIVAACFYAFGSALTLVPGLGGRQERRQFTTVFIIVWMVSGIAAIYARVFGDYEQLFSDAANFYYYSATGYSSLSMEDLLELTEGAGAVVLWSYVYEVFEALGFERLPYVGIGFNVLQIGLSAVLAVKIVRSCFGEDDARLDRLGLLIGTCGTLWLFGAMHLRDAAIMLLASALIYAWVTTLTRISGARLLVLLVFSVLASFAFQTLRQEFVFVPAILLLAAVFVMMAFGARQVPAHWIVLLLAVGIAAVIGLAILNFEDLSKALETGKTEYGEEAAQVSSHDSLGTKFIVDAILPLRLLLGSIYLYVFPIPVWVGFQTESAYNLFKSANAIYFYFVGPLLALAAYEIYRSRELRTLPVMFLSTVIVGFTLAIAGTSLETRHIGSFLVPLVVLALIPDLGRAAVWRTYRYLVGIVVFGAVAVHMLWAVLKFGI